MRPRYLIRNMRKRNPYRKRIYRHYGKGPAGSRQKTKETNNSLEEQQKEGINEYYEKGKD